MPPPQAGSLVLRKLELGELQFMRQQLLAVGIDHRQRHRALFPVDLDQPGIHLPMGTADPE